ncbi:hypothetical protein KF913_09410 [Candidatus Obscuribacterales bacterium]|nr:hypothetical protein [Candidatus Obscuribacterales bacterium]
MYNFFSLIHELRKPLVAVFAVLGLIVFQKEYKRANTTGVEQPIGILGILEYELRHIDEHLGLTQSQR